MQKRVALILGMLLFTLLTTNASISTANGSTEASTITTAEQKADLRPGINKLVYDSEYIFSSPTRWDKSDWDQFLLSAGGTYLIYENDKHIQHWFQAKRNCSSNRVARVGNALPAAGMIYLGGSYLLGNDITRTKAAIGLESTGISLAVAETLKVIVHRHRPGCNDETDSFPSAHTAVAFSLATVISQEYSDSKSITPLCFGLATITGISRLNDNRHWASDIIAGGLIGYYVTKTVIRLNTDPKADLKLQPFATTDSAGILIIKRY